MDDTEIRYILRQNEGETLEFKRFEKLEKINDKKKKDLVKLFVALANNKGGRILFGVTDDREFDDYKLTEEKYKEYKQKLIQIADSNCDPPIYLNNIQQINVDDHIILLVDVPSGKNLPHAFEGNFYIRIQDQNIKITDPYKIEELIEQKRGINREIVVEKEEGQSVETFSTEINKYLNLIIKEENILIHDDIELGICEVYTELSAKLPDKKILPITVKFNEPENKREEESGVFELVEKEKKLIISGVSGSGKTITLKWLNLTFTEKYLREDDCSIPLYVGLNTYKSGDFYNYIRIKVKEKGVSESTLKLLLKGKLIFLIDGLDLLSSTEDFKPYTEISNFISEYSECRYVISSRPGFYEEIQNKFKICIIEELDLPKIRLFINNYIDDEKLSNAVAEKILNNKKLRSLFTNPMMLYIAIIVIKSRLDGKIKIDKILPSKRSELYNNFISELFMRHKREGKSLITDKRQILKVITNLYFKLQCKNWVDCEYEYAIEIALEHSFDKNQISAKYILDDLFKIGLLKKEESLQGDYIKYGIHQSFQEYFAALKLKECFEKNYDLSPVFKHPKWEDVVIFASEMFDSPDEFIFKIIDNNELDLASKCVQNATKKIKENLCINLAEKIDNRYISEKTDAVKSLGRLGDIGISLINEVLNHENRYVRRGAADALGKIKSDKAVDGLLKALYDGDPSVQSSAADALGEIKSDKAVDGLIKALADEDPSVRTCASSALGEIKSDKAVDGLIKALAAEDYEVQMSASCSLKKIKSDKAVDGLLKALAHEDFRVRTVASSTLGKIKSERAVEPLIKALNHENTDVRSHAAYALGEIKSERAVEPLIKALNDENTDVRSHAVDALGKIESERAVESLIKALNDENKYVRSHAADALEKIKSERAVEPLIKALNHENRYVRSRAADALGKIESDKAVDGLIKALANEALSVRSRAVDALGKIESDKAVDGLIKALADEYPSVRRGAAHALGKIKADKAVDGLIKALADKDSWVRRGAADALGKIKSDKAVDGLIKALADKNPSMGKSAANALGEIKSERAVEPLIKALNDENTDVRSLAADALGEIKSERAVEPLIKALNDENTDVRMWAADALGEIKSERAVEPLTKALNDENTDVRRWAACALGKMKSERAVEQLTKALNHKNRYERRRAVDALGEIITIQNKHLLEPLLESENESIAKISYDILKKINENERSKQKIILEKIPTSEKDEPSRLDNLQKPCGEPAEKGLQDPYIGSFIDRLKSIKKPTTIVDYGCGQGKLLCALTTLPDVAINNISYFGVDEKTRCRYISRLTSEKYGLTKSLKKYPEFFKPKNFYLKDIRLDYALLMHALHEIELRDLIEIIYSISSKLNIGGQIFILDQRELIEKERNFVIWNDLEYFKMLFSDSGFEHSPRFFNTGSNKKLSSVEAIKIKEGCFSKENTAKNCLTVYYSKKKRVSDLLKKNKINYEDYQNLSILYSNISNQIDDYYKFLKLNDNDLYFILREFFKKSE